MEPCSYECPHMDVCYHRRKNTLSSKMEGVLPPNFREELLERGCTIHESVCRLEPMHFTLLRTFKKYNITLPYPLVTNELLTFRDQIQISVYTKEQARALPTHQKLFLLKNNESLEYAKKHGFFNTPFSFMHFNVNQDWITNKVLSELFLYRLLSNAHRTTLDSCIESGLQNGRCPYNHGNYVDITFDGTLRTCPFTRDGIPITEVYDGTYESLFKIPHRNDECKYINWFGEVNGENKHTSIQDNGTDNKN
jgi:hypothetical protein